MKPWMIEASYEYMKTARLAFDNNLILPSFINASLSIEILFKSFTSEICGDPGGIGETYSFNRKAVGIKGHGHDLLQLFDAIPSVTIDELGFIKYREFFEKYYTEPFVVARYPYEGTAPGTYSDHIIEIAEEMIQRTIKHYQSSGCDDPWIASICVP